MPLNKNVTICIPTYNAESTLAESLESILAQTYGNLHLIVVDNASTDKTCELVEKYMALDDRVSLNRNHVNVGGEGNFTRCLNLAAGDYTAIFHADDVYEPDMVLRQVELLETRPGSGMVFSNASLIDDKGHIYGEHILPPELFQTYHGHLDLKAALGLLVRDGNFFICPSAMARTHIYQQLKQWSRYNFGSSSDLDVWLRVLQNHEVTVLPEKLMRYRTSPESFTWHYAFLRTERSDFYTVMDEYVYNINPDLVSRQGNIDYRLY
jgi:glycosyltransferase involved in cell wall biosynthesis